MEQKNKSKTVIRAILLVATVVSLWFVPWSLLIAWMEPLPDAVQQQVDGAIDMGFDGIIVYVDKGDSEPDFYAAGWKNTENRIQVDPHALFKIASIDKLYTAVSVAKLVADDQLAFALGIAGAFPELLGRIDYADSITLKMMVEHGGGIPSFTNTPGFWVNPPDNNQETLELVLDLPANFEPGEDYEYSNTNYLLITELIEKATGMSKFQFIKNEILDPLGLKNTFGSIHDVDMDDLMSGYYVGVDEDIKTADYGSMVATAEDVGIFLRALNDGSLLNDQEQEIYSSIYQYNHTGLIPGYQSIAKYHPDIDTVVIQFTNTTNFDGYNWTLSEIVYNRVIKILRDS